MPLGKSPVLQNELMAEGDNQKHLLFNDSLVALEDAANRAVEIDLSIDDAAITEMQLLRHVYIICTGNAVPREIVIPISVGSPVVTTNRLFAVRNTGTDTLTVTHNNGGDAIVIPAGESSLVYADGIDIVSLAGAAAAETASTIKTKYESNADTNAFTDALLTKLSNIEASATADQTDTEIEAAYNNQVGQVSGPEKTAGTETEIRRFSPKDVADIAVTHGGGSAVSDEGTETLASPTDINFAGAGVTVADDGDGTVTVTIPGASSSYKGTYVDATALDTAHPAPAVGSYAYVDAGVGNDAELYIWDDDDSAWVLSGGTVSGGASVSDEGTQTLAAPTDINFAGAGVSVADDADGTVTVTIPGTTVAVSDEGTETLASPTDINFAGAGVSVADDGDGTVTVTVPGASSSYKGTYVDATALDTAHPSPAAGSYAYVDAGVGNDVELYIWDNDDSAWVLSGGTGASAIAVSDEGVQTLAAPTDINFAGAGVSVADDTDGTVTVTIPGATVPPMTQSEITSAHTVTDGDLAGNVHRRITIASASDVTVPTGLTGTEPATFTQSGSGQLTFAPAVGVTINSADGNLKTRVQFSSATLIPVAGATDTFDLVGDLAA